VSVDVTIFIRLATVMHNKLSHF